MSNVLSELNDRWMVFLGWEAAFLLTQRAQCSYWPRGSSVLTGPEGPVFLLTQRVQCSYWPRGLYSIPCTNHWQQVKLYREKLHLLKLLEALPSEPKIKTLYPIYLTQWPICFFSPLVSHISKSLLIFSPNVNALFRLIINSLSLLLILSHFFCLSLSLSSTSDFLAPYGYLFSQPTPHISQCAVRWSYTKEHQVTQRWAKASYFFFLSLREREK